MDEIEKSWYKFHFGSDCVNGWQDLPDFFGKIFRNCFILFADFCNFTRFFSASDNLDELEPLLRKYYTSSRKVIHHNYGMLDKILGDGFLAIWGLHKYNFDMETNIIKCVKELNEIGLEIAGEWQSLIDVHIEEVGMRFGLAKGKIITIKRNDTYPGLSIVGEPINLSARLQARAEPGELVVSNKAFSNLRKLSLNFKNQKTDIEVKGIGAVKSFCINVKCLG